MAQGWSRGWFLGSSVLGLDTRRWGASFGDVTTWNTWCIWDRDDFTYLPPILAYYICFVPSAFVWYAALGSHQLACTGGRNLGWSFWISRGYLSSDSSGDSRPRVQGFRSHFLTVCTKVIRTVVFSMFMAQNSTGGFYFEVQYISISFLDHAQTSSWSKANLCNASAVTSVQYSGVVSPQLEPDRTISTQKYETRTLARHPALLHPAWVSSAANGSSSCQRRRDSLGSYEEGHVLQEFGSCILHDFTIISIRYIVLICFTFYMPGLSLHNYSQCMKLIEMGLGKVQY